MRRRVVVGGVITDPERTALDLFARPEIFGGMAVALELLEENLVRLDLARLVEYALRCDVGALIKRLGWSLERMGAPEEVRAAAGASRHRLVPARSAGRTPRRALLALAHRGESVSWVKFHSPSRLTRF